MDNQRLRQLKEEEARISVELLTAPLCSQFQLEVERLETQREIRELEAEAETTPSRRQMAS